jgi:hypothetical protein
LAKDPETAYIISLEEGQRRPNASPAIETSLAAFQENFNIFSSSSLRALCWDNVVVAGGAVTTTLLPVPETWKARKHEYYHEHFAPNADVDLFIYGLDEDQARQKIKDIERSVKAGIGAGTQIVTVRASNAITIVSQYPTRHIQIVLRLYTSISQILTGFDVDCACVAYTGAQVYASPRALAAFVTQCNTVDVTRRSLSYEHRILKYKGRGFALCGSIDHSRINPVIYDLPLRELQGAAKLLVLDKRASVGDKRLEDCHSSWYYTVVIPYGPGLDATKITQLLREQELKRCEKAAERQRRTGQSSVKPHSHLYFIGTAEEVIQDCCGQCPVSKTSGETEAAARAYKTYVSGMLKFMTVDPGCQQIGSFNPIADSDWTSTAYKS